MRLTLVKMVLSRIMLGAIEKLLVRMLMGMLLISELMTEMLPTPWPMSLLTPEILNLIALLLIVIFC